MDAGEVCTETADCDDGLFCTGAEVCNPSDPTADPDGCVRPGQRCMRLGEVCSEELMRCVVCSPSTPSEGWDIDGDGAISIVCGGDDCDDADPNRFPGNTEVCDPDGVDEDCDPTTFGTTDIDGDGEVSSACCNVDDEGMSHCGPDCDDHRAEANSAATEDCNLRDDDCDGSIDEDAQIAGFVDDDRDLHGDPDRATMGCPFTPGFATVGDDCDDADTTVHGEMPEICDGRDNDCDGSTDEEKAQITWYRDEDSDGFGAADTTVIACVPPEGFSVMWTDCDDNDPEVHPKASEVCDARDNDCNGRADFVASDGSFEDDDRDGVADMACGGADCDDENPDVYPATTSPMREAAPEYCDGVDNDCDPDTPDDMDLEATFYRDADGDGWGVAAMMMADVCMPPEGYVARPGDCDDADPARHPTRFDGCDGEDQDCDLRVDEDLAQRAYYNDVDDDGVAGGMPVILSCRQPEGFSPQAADCNDMDPSIPAAAEVCDGAVDEDCDGAVDEGC